MVIGAPIVAMILKLAKLRIQNCTKKYISIYKFTEFVLIVDLGFLIATFGW